MEGQEMQDAFSRILKVNSPWQIREVKFFDKT